MHVYSYDIFVSVWHTNFIRRGHYSGGDLCVVWNGMARGYHLVAHMTHDGKRFYLRRQFQFIRLGDFTQTVARCPCAASVGIRSHHKTGREIPVRNAHVVRNAQCVVYKYRYSVLCVLYGYSVASTCCCWIYIVCYVRTLLKWVELKRIRYALLPAAHIVNELK